jgi:hypothetical protein
VVGVSDFLPATGPVSGWRVTVAHVLPLPLAAGSGAIATHALSVGDGTGPLGLIAAVAFGIGAVSVFLQLIVRYCADPGLRALCVARIAPELLPTGVLTPAVVCLCPDHGSPAPGQGDGGEPA